MNNKEEIKVKLEKLNQNLGKINLEAELVIVGGAFIILQNLVPRATADIDFINKVQDDVKDIMGPLNINDRASMYDHNFGHWRNDLKKLLTYDSLKVYIFSIERFLVSRLFSRKRIGDFEYIFKEQNINKEKFEKILFEAYELCDPIYIKEFKENIYAIKKAYKTKGWDYEKSNTKKLCDK